MKNSRRPYPSRQRESFDDLRSGGVVSPRSYAPSVHFDKIIVGLNGAVFAIGNLPPLPKKSVYVFEQRRDRGILERVHIVLSDFQSSLLGLVWVWFMLVVILLSCACFVLQTSPEYLAYTHKCVVCKPLTGAGFSSVEEQALRAQHKDECVGCEPKPLGILQAFEVVTVAIFTFEYVARCITCPFALSEREALTLKGREYPQHRAVLRLKDFLFAGQNFLDLIAVAPYWATQVLPGLSGFQVIRILRLFRVPRILRLGKLSEGTSLFARCLHRSLMAFVIFLIFSLFGILLFASLIYFAEAGSWDPGIALTIVAISHTRARLRHQSHFVRFLTCLLTSRNWFVPS